MTSVSPNAPGYPADLKALTSLRAFLALGVVLFHYQLQLDPALGYSPIVERSRLAVDAFFMLSGFILAHVYGPSFADGSFSYRRFIVARLARLYPLHLFILLTILAMVLMALALGVRFDPATYTVRGFFEVLFLVHAWFPEPVGINWSGPSWSLSAEWFAYLIFPLYAGIALKLRARPIVLLLIGVAGFIGIDAVYRLAFGEVLPRAEDAMGILRILPEFLIGMAMYGLGRNWLWPRRTAILASIASVAALLIGMQLSLDDRLIVALAAPVILCWSMLARADCEGILASPPLILAGEVSFALYLVHTLIVVAWKGAVSEMRGIDSHFFVQPIELAGLIAFTAVVALLLHLFVEKPGRRWLRARLDAPTTPAPDRSSRPAHPRSADAPRDAA